MTLRDNLQEIRAEAINNAMMAHSPKIDSLPDPAQELELQEQGYENLMRIPVLLYEALMNSGYDEANAALIATGASLAVHILVEVAETESLPPLG